MPKVLLQEIENLIHPLGFVWMLLLLGFALKLKRKQFRGAGFHALLAALLWVGGASRFPDWAAGRLENFAPKPDWNQIPPMDLVVMLGGVLNASDGDIFGFELAGAADRALTAIEFVRRNPPKTLVFMGSFERGRGKAEGALVKEWVEQWKVTPPGVEIRFGPPCRNTFEEARAISALASELKAERIALITSATHMRRAVTVFKSAGLNVLPVPCDFQEAHRGDLVKSPTRIVPSGLKMQLLATVLHEHLSWNYYRLRGWIHDGTAASK